jgi:hypothetical protein
MPEPSRAELLALLDRAREALEESQHHWGAVLHLTGDRRYQRQQQEILKLIEAMRRRVLL